MKNGSQLLRRQRNRGDVNVPATPGCSMWGWNIHSEASYCSEPTLISRPSGSCVASLGHHYFALEIEHSTHSAVFYQNSGSSASLLSSPRS